MADEFDPAKFAAAAPAEADAFDPAAFAAGKTTSAPAPEKKSFIREAAGRVADTARGAVEAVKHPVETAKSAGRAIAHTVAEAGREVADEATHPLRTLQGAPLARLAGYSTPEAVKHADAVNREGVRGFQGNIPLAGLAHERLTGFPETSAADAAEAPHAGAVGTVAGAAAIPLATSYAPLVGRGLARAANASQDALLAASEASVARSAARRAVSATPVRDAVKEAAKEASSHAIHKTVAATLAHQLPGGHYIAPLVAGASVAKPVGKAALTAADEGFAALARRAGVGAESVAESPALRNLRDALKTATPEQAESIKASIAGLERRAAAGARPARAPEPDTVAAEYEPPPSVDIEEEAPTYRSEGRTTPAVEGAPERRALPPMEEPAAAAPPRSTPAGAREPGAPRRPVETTGYQRVVDAEDAKRRPAEARRSPMYQKAVDRMARAARAATSQRDFVRDAVEGGMDARDARKIWRAAHPYKPAPAAELETT